MNRFKYVFPKLRHSSRTVPKCLQNPPKSFPTLAAIIVLVALVYVSTRRAATEVANEPAPYAASPWVPPVRRWLVVLFVVRCLVVVCQLVCAVPRPFNGFCRS